MSRILLNSNYGLRCLGLNPDCRALIECGLKATALDRRISRRNCSSKVTNPQGLPHLPLPPLNETLDRFLKTVEPHLNDKEFTKTIKLTNDFANGKGKKLQELLEDQAKRSENWLADWWLDSAYLTYRDPVVVYSSPGLVFPSVERFRSEFDRLTYAAKVISACLNYKDLIDKNKIPVDKFGKSEMDMQQYNKIFGTCRIPGVEKDSLSFNPKSTHIIVMHKSNYFKVPVYGGSNGTTILSEKELLEQLQMCLTSKKNSSPIGLLTSDHRNNWGRAYQVLMKDGLNKKSVSEIEKSLFVVALDDLVPFEGGYYNSACHQLITGGGSKANTGNRWYDKTVQVIIGEQGINGLTYEHSPAEGVPIALMTDFILNYVSKSKILNDTQPIGNFKQPEELKFNITSEVQDFITSAGKNIDALSGNLDMYTLEFKDYGKNFIKTYKMSPDSFIQMAMQYAFYRLHGVPGAHYESASTRLYVHGRTETIRSCSNESIAFAKAMVSTVSDTERVQKLRAAVEAHKKYTLLAMQGKGVDRHLLGLKLTAAKNGIDVSDFYSDLGLIKSAHMRLSTSQVASKYEAVMCYGPLTDDGYGCCYNPRDDDMIFAISSFKSCNETDAMKFGAVMKDSLLHMKNLLANTPTSKL